MSNWIHTSWTTKRWRLAVIASAVMALAALGTWLTGQYKIGKLDAVIAQFNAPIEDFAREIARVKPESLQYELLDGCKQVQIGSWLQTTDALKFKDPLVGNRVQVELEQGRDFIDLNGKEMSVCMRDELENQQFDIGSMTNTWAFSLFMMAVLFGALGYLGWRGRNGSITPPEETKIAVNDEIAKDVNS